MEDRDCCQVSQSNENLNSRRLFIIRIVIIQGFYFTYHPSFQSGGGREDIRRELEARRATTTSTVNPLQRKEAVGAEGGRWNAQRACSG
jgi:hypothetical protein